MASFSEGINISELKESLYKIKKKLECPICLELLSDPYMTLCSHPFCRDCIHKALTSNKGAQCPLCKLTITKRSLIENRQLGEIIDSFKELEEVIVRNAGKDKTPPRVVHTHEGSGTPGLLLHSLAHPSPSKPSTSANVSNIENESASSRYPKRKCKGRSTESDPDQTTAAPEVPTREHEHRRPTIKRRRRRTHSSRKTNKPSTRARHRQELLTALQDGPLRNTDPTPHDNTNQTENNIFDVTNNDVFVHESPTPPHHSHLLPPTQPLTVADSLPAEQGHTPHATTPSPGLSTQELRHLVSEKEREVVALEAMLRVTSSTLDDVTTSSNGNSDAVIINAQQSRQRGLKLTEQDSGTKTILETQFTDHPLTQTDPQTIELSSCSAGAGVNIERPAKRTKLLVELDSEDVESCSPITHYVHLSPLPDDHPFMSISTTPRPLLEEPHPLLDKPHPPEPTTKTDPVTPTTSVGSKIVQTPVVSVGGFPSPGGVVRPSLSLVGSGLTKEQLRQAQVFARKEGGRIASIFNSHTTHVVVCTDPQGLCPRTMKYLLGVLARVWLVTFQWVEDSLKEGQLLAEGRYEVRGDKTLTSVSHSVPSIARLSRLHEEPGLFSSCVFYIHCNCKSLSKDELAQLVCMGGGQVVESVTSDSVTVCDCEGCEGGAPVITSNSILDTISRYKPITPS